MHPRKDGVITAARCEAGDDALGLRVTKDSLLAVASADAAQFHAAHGRIKTVVDHQRRIDINRSGFDRSCDAARLSRIATPNRRIQTEVGIVRTGHGFFHATDFV